MSRASARIAAVLLAWATWQAACGDAHGQAGTWQSIAPALQPRTYASMASHDGTLYLSPGGLTASFEAYVPAGNAWSALPALTLRAATLSVVLDGKVHIVGGCINSNCESLTGLLEIYNPATNAVALGAPLATPRYGAAGGTIARRIYVTAGGACSGCAQPTSLEVFDPDTGAWTSGAPIPTPREYPASAVSGNKLYVIGGYRRTGSGAVPTNIVEAYDPTANSWSTVAPIPVAAMNSAAATTPDGRIHVTGGHDAVSTVFGHHYVYDPATDAWSLSTPMLAPRFSHGSAAIGSSLYVVAGAATLGSVPLATGEVLATAPPPSTHVLTVSLAGNGAGTVASAPAGISCPASCVAAFSAGSAVTLTATPSGGSTFQGWSGACTGTAPCTISMTAATAVTAAFTIQAAAPTLLPASLDFGGQSLGTTSRPRTATLSNPANAAITVSGASHQHFAVMPRCTSIPALGSCLVDVTFTPRAAAAISASVPIQTSIGAVSLQLTGVGEHSLVSHYYASILGRLPDAGGKAFWEAQAVRLSKLGIDINEAWYALAMSFFASTEYAQLGRDDGGYVTDLYRTFFNREPDGGGFGFWTSQLSAGMPREVVLAGFMLSPEFIAFTRSIFGNNAAGAEVDIVIDFYRGLLGRLPDPDGFTFWLGRVRAAQCNGSTAMKAEVDEISRQFLGGIEYHGRGRTDAQFIGDLYNAFLRRGGDLVGVQYWINRLSAGATREQLRLEFLESGEFSTRVNAAIAAGCQRLAEGSFRYQGALPARGRVAFATIAREEAVAPDAYLGWAQFVTSPMVAFAAVDAAVVAAGGEIIAAIPKLGIYRARVAVGSERAFLLAMYANSWVKRGAPVTPLSLGARRNRVLDANGGGGHACGDRHGSIVQAIANRRGGAFELEELAEPVPPDALAEAVRRNMAAVPQGDRRVINLSWNIAPPGSLADEVTGSCDLACTSRAYLEGEAVLLSQVFAAMQAAWEDDPGVANRTALVMIIGNPGLLLDPLVATLKAEYPEAFDRIALVGGVDASGSPRNSSGTPYFNYSDHADVVFARGVQVGASTPLTGAVQCTGTSFAGPEVASVLDQVWEAKSGGTSAELVRALRHTARPGRVLPQDANGLTTGTFIANAQGAFIGYRLTLTTLGTGSGTITPSPFGPTYPSHTVVIVLQVPASGSTFGGWSGACSGTSGCVVTMDADKTVFATFNATTPVCTATISSSSLVVPATQTSGNVSVNIPAGCAWSAAVDASWITVSPGGGNGPGSVTYTVQANSSPTSRVGHVVIAGNTLTITQLGGTFNGMCSFVNCTPATPATLFEPADPCMCSNPPGGAEGPCGTATVAFEDQSCLVATCASGLRCVSTRDRGRICMTAATFTATQCLP